jgi:hypothetical protein
MSPIFFVGDFAKLRWRIERDYQELSRRSGLGTMRARMARLPSSRHAVHRSLRIPDLREGDDWLPCGFGHSFFGRAVFRSSRPPRHDTAGSAIGEFHKRGGGLSRKISPPMWTAGVPVVLPDVRPVKDILPPFVGSQNACDSSGKREIQSCFENHFSTSCNGRKIIRNPGEVHLKNESDKIVMRLRHSAAQITALAYWLEPPAAACAR